MRQRCPRQFLEKAFSTFVVPAHCLTRWGWWSRIWWKRVWCSPARTQTSSGLSTSLSLTLSSSLSCITHRKDGILAQINFGKTWFFPSELVAAFQQASSRRSRLTGLESSQGKLEFRDSFDAIWTLQRYEVQIIMCCCFFLEFYKNLYFRCQEVLGKLGIFGKKTSSN